mgnify:CR=1 FL=1|tara:strand:- start:797 stop:1018 length:222 start_codon:yes stop_codon:yes gene_type:complete
MLRKKTKNLTSEQISDIISMALSDDVSFNTIKATYEINSDEIKRIMKDNISFGSYKCWRKRVKRFSARRQHYK